ncbi:MAG: hypothetical protein ACI96P_000567, partial [Candidatus Azotimanducaceae bacterium]
THCDITRQIEMVNQSVAKCASECLVNSLREEATDVTQTKSGERLFHCWYISTSGAER